MTTEEIKLKCIELALPITHSEPSHYTVIRDAQKLYNWVTAEMPVGEQEFEQIRQRYEETRLKEYEQKTTQEKMNEMGQFIAAKANPA